jgi:hypothetical protein
VSEGGTHPSGAAPDGRAGRGRYPFGRAPGSFFLGAAGPDALPAGPPLLAYGANGSPEVLARKLPGVAVAALAGVLTDWAIVHSAHVSPYGQVPATLVPAPGGQALVHVLLVEPAGRAPLDATEPNYDRVTLTGLALDVEHLGRTPTVEAYVSKHGPLLLRGATVALGALSQDALLEAVRAFRSA